MPTDRLSIDYGLTGLNLKLAPAGVPEPGDASALKDAAGAS